MESLCYKQLDQAFDELKDYKDDICKDMCSGSYEKIDYYTDLYGLSNLFDKYQVYNFLRKTVIDFLEFYTIDNTCKDFYKKQLEQNASPLFLIYQHFEYLICNYIGKREIYGSFPAFIKGLVEFFELSDIKLTEDEYYNVLKKSDYNKFEENYREDYEKLFIKPVPRSPQNNYNSYNMAIIGENINFSDKEIRWRWAERDTHSMERKYLHQNNVDDIDKKVIWVSRYHGDGFGYDILSYDKETDNEKLIEVKTTLGKSFELSSDELRRMYYVANNDHCDYYIYGYFFKEYQPNLVKLKLDKETMSFIDIDNNDKYYISPSIQYPLNSNTGKNEEEIKIYLEKEDEYMELKNRKPQVKQK